MVLPEQAAHHAHRVLRLAAGDAVVVFDGLGGEYPARLTTVGAKVRVQLGEFRPGGPESPLVITLVQGLAVADKMDWIVQKGTELGVVAVHPVMAERSVLKLSGDRAAKRLEHWQGVAIAACEQSGRNRVPQVSEVRSLTQWLGDWRGQMGEGASAWILDPAQGESLGSFSAPVGPLALLVGPEGGWSERELLAARAAGCVSVRLGPRVMRTETAGLAALAALQALWGDFQ